MGADSNPPPPSGGGAKYAVLGLVLLGGAAAVYFATREDPPAEPVAEAPPPQAEQPRRSTSLYREDLVIPDDDELEDEEEEQEAAPQPKRRAVRKPAACEGEVNKAQVRQVFMQNERQVRACYERRLKVNNVLQGRLDLEVRLAKNGAVDSVRVGGTLRDNEVHACVRRAAQSWTFPPLESGNCAVVGLPYNLTPSM
jgi:hypothetical protein